MRISAWAGLLVKSPPPKIAIKQLDETNTHLEIKTNLFFLQLVVPKDPSFSYPPLHIFSNCKMFFKKKIQHVFNID